MIANMDEEEAEKFARVYRNCGRLLVCVGEYGSSSGRTEWGLIGPERLNPPKHLLAVLDLVPCIEGTGFEERDEEWMFTKDEWISMNAGCPELLELASKIKE
ncbi:hypothetical protein D3C87_1197300 [compost metagenome]